MRMDTGVHPCGVSVCYLAALIHCRVLIHVSGIILMEDHSFSPKILNIPKSIMPVFDDFPL